MGCDNGKIVQCVDGSMEYLGPAAGCTSTKDCLYSKNTGDVTVSHGFVDNDCVNGKAVECVDGSMEYRGPAQGCPEEPAKPEGDVFVPPTDPPLTQVTNMVDDFTSLAKTHLGVGSTLYNNVVDPVVKLTAKMKSVNRRFNCENGTLIKPSRRVQRSTSPCPNLIGMVDDIITWNKVNVYSCYKDEVKDKPARLGKRFAKKLKAVKTKLVLRCERRRHK